MSTPALPSGTVVAPGPASHEVVSPQGERVPVPAGWILLPPGDAGLTRRVKLAGPHWVMQQKVGRKLFSRGIWASSTTIANIQAELEKERSTESYAKRRAADGRRREAAQGQYVEDFHGAVVAFLSFHASYAELAQRLAELVTQHATPVGSGTVARTKRIPIEARAEAAVIAWMRHQTTAYDEMKIPRVKGKRREVRRQLAAQSHHLLHRYRQGLPIPHDCPLRGKITC